MSVSAQQGPLSVSSQMSLGLSCVSGLVGDGFNLSSVLEKSPGGSPSTQGDDDAESSTSGILKKAFRDAHGGDEEDPLT